MKALILPLALAFSALTGTAHAGDWEFTRYHFPKGSALQSQVKYTPEKKLDDSREDIRKAIEKVIPIGTSEEDAAKLFAVPLPKPKEKAEADGKDLPKEFKGKPYKCFRLMDTVSLKHAGSDWFEALFFFEDGKLARVWVDYGGVSL